ncbi:MAG: FeoB small GTPase domain-containing protein [bacterium]|nr:FeoB small GTPase domain-containing protein [bacterium]
MAKDFYADASFYKKLPVGSQLLEDDLLLLTIGETLSGKTALVNALEYNCVTAGTWPGSTVPRVAVDADILGRRVRVLDMNGAHGTSINEIEEMVRQDGIIDKHHVALLCVVNADALARSLPFIIELTELGVPLVVGLRDCENAKNKGIMLNLDVISNILDIPILTDIGDRVLKLEDIAAKILATNPSTFTVRYNKAVETSVAEVMSELSVNTNRWLAISSVQGLQVTVPEKAQLKATQQNISWRSSGSDFGDIVVNTRLQLANGILREIDCHTTDLNGFEKQMSVQLSKPALGIPVILLTALVMLHLGFSLARPWMAWINSLAAITAGFVAGCRLPELAQSAINRCLIEGLGSFLSVMPMMFVFFFVLCFLEESGMVARFGHSLRSIGRILGISDQALTPALQCTACTVQGINTIGLLPSRSSQTRAALAIPFVPCVGRLAVLACLAAIFCPDKAAYILIGIYAGGVLLTALALLFNKFLERKIVDTSAEETEEERIELPPCRIPSLKILVSAAGILSWNFFVTAIIPVMITLLAVWSLITVNKMEMVSGWFAWAFKPLGLENWRMVGTILSGFFAKEAMLASAALTFLVNDPCQAMTIPQAGSALWQATITAFQGTLQAFLGFFSWNAVLSSANDVPVKLASKITPMFKLSQISALLVFTAFSAPCVPAFMALVRSAGGKYAIINWFVQFAVAWLLALIVCHVV